MKKEKEIHIGFTVIPQTAKVMAAVQDKYLVKMEKTQNLWAENINSKHVLIDSKVLHQKALSLYKGFSKGSLEMSNYIHITFIIVYYYSYSDLLFDIIVNFLLCLI